MREYGMQGGLLLDALALPDDLIHATTVIVALNTIRSNNILAISPGSRWAIDQGGDW